MPQQTPNEEGPTLKVQQGNRIFLARRLSSGNWHLSDRRGFHFRTVNNAEFQSQFTKVPEKADGNE
jgi:hypothetical protein